MPDVEYLFVYGTLMRRLRHPMHRVVARYASYLCEAEAKGVLYDLGPYPAMRPGDGRVYGELYRIHDASRLFGVLDRYEGDEYVRRTISLCAAGSRRVDAWAYLYRNGLPSSRKIVSGTYARRKGGSFGQRRG
ncbi:gamma-glutamylcyclotransferase family protein [Hydrogenimonas sp.]